MGLNIFSTGSIPGDEILPPPNPNPKNYTILQEVGDGDYVLMLVKYFDCTTFEGIKLLLYHKNVAAHVKRMKFIDPHFNDKGYSPIARFHIRFMVEALNFMHRLGRGCED